MNGPRLSAKDQRHMWRATVGLIIGLILTAFAAQFSDAAHVYGGSDQFRGCYLDRPYFLARLQAEARAMISNECPEGWKALVAPLIEQCEKEGVKIAQIKEKFGALRFYLALWEKASPGLQTEIDAAERASITICQECGGSGRTREKNGWLRTLCDSHAADMGFGT